MKNLLFGLCFICSLIYASEVPEVPTNIDNLILLAKEKLSDSLKDPESAKFRKVFLSATFNKNTFNGWAICGEMNGKNSYGGYTGYKPFIVFIEKEITGIVNETTDYEILNKNCSNSVKIF